MTEPSLCAASILGEDDIVHRAVAVTQLSGQYLPACQLLPPLEWHPRVRWYELTHMLVTCIACLGAS